MRSLNRDPDGELFSDQPRFAKVTPGEDLGSGLEFVGWLVFVMLLALFDCLVLLLSQWLPDNIGE